MNVLISINSKWCELIASGKKTVEVRKTKPKLETPFKVYIYCTKGEHLWKTKDRVFLDGKYNRLIDDLPDYLLDGKVIGEFVCDDIVIDEKGENSDILRFYGNLTHAELWEYGRNKTLYGWHISDLVIYDKPRVLSEFIIPSKIGCCNEGKCRGCKYFDCGNGYNVEDDCNAIFSTDEFKPLRTPPHSWCYVECAGDARASIASFKYINRLGYNMED